MLLKLDDFGVQPLFIDNEALLKSNFAFYQFHSLQKTFVKRSYTSSIMADYLFILSCVYVTGQNYIRVKFFNLDLILIFHYLLALIIIRAKGQRNQPRLKKF